MSTALHPKAHPIIADPDAIARVRPTFTVRDHLTGEPMYLRDEERVNLYAAHFATALEV